jgi:NADH-quinone oxidoreductase subunit B
MPFGTACCAIELMAVIAARFDLARFGAEAIRFTPRQADLMIVAGRVSLKELPILKRIWDQMPEPKWSIAMGACASSGGVFDTYTLVQGVDNFIPVDAYIPGCPPRPEAIIEALMLIQRKIKADPYLKAAKGSILEIDFNELPGGEKADMTKRPRRLDIGDLRWDPRK